MLQASNSNVVAAKAAKRKATPRLKLNALGEDAMETAAPIAPARAKPAKQPRLKLKDPAKPSARAKQKAPSKQKLPAKAKEAGEAPAPRKAKAVAEAIAPAMPVVPVTPAVPVAPEVKPRRELDLLHAITLAVAVVLAVIAAYFSVSGMTRIFPGAELAVIVMTATMEAGKLAGAAWLSRNWSVMALGLRTVLSALVVILACINAVGVFGQLSAAHLNPHVSAITANETEAANQNAKIDAQQRLLADLTRRISQIDSAIEEATKRGRSSSAMDLAKEQRRNRADLVQQRSKEEAGLIELRTAQARTTGEQQKAAADVGVLQYAATLFGIDREQMIQLLILSMVLSCDPLSITLVIATASRRQAKTA